MLSLVTATEIKPEAEALDRDPGIVSLISALARFATRCSSAVLHAIRALNQRVNEAEVASSSSAWPYNHRSK